MIVFGCFHCLPYGEHIKIKGLRQFVTWYPRHVSENPGYIVKSAKEGANGKFISIVAAIAQVFFTFDVISIMILAIKEKKCIKATIISIILAVVAIFSFILFCIISSI